MDDDDHHLTEVVTREGSRLRRFIRSRVADPGEERERVRRSLHDRFDAESA